LYSYIFTGIIVALVLITLYPVPILSERIYIPGSTNSTLEHYLCSSTTIPDNTELFIEKSQYVNNGAFCVVHNISNLVITGPISAPINITCSPGERGFGFVSVTRLQISNILFQHCGGFLSQSAIGYINSSSTFHYYYEPTIKAVMLFNHCPDLQLSNVTISNYQGFSIIGINLCGQVLFDNVVQQDRYGSTPQNSPCTHQFIDYGGGTFLYYIDSDIASGTSCYQNNTFLDIGLTSKGNQLVCFNTGLYNYLEQRVLGIPAKSYANFMLTYGQTGFQVQSGLNLDIFDSNTISSVVVISATMVDHSTITLSGLYENNVGTVIHGYFAYYSCAKNLPPTFSTLQLTNLKFIRNKFPLGPSIFVRSFENMCNQPLSFVEMTMDNIIWEKNFLGKLFLAHGPQKIESTGLNIVVKNVSSKNNSEFRMGSFLPMFDVLDINNVSFLGDVYISGGGFSPCIRCITCSLYMSGRNITFLEGRAPEGGAIQLANPKSLLYLIEPLQIAFINNSATLGAAIYAEDLFRVNVLFSAKSYCTLQVISSYPQTTSNITDIDISVQFKNNLQGDASVSIFSNNFNVFCCNDGSCDQTVAGSYLFHGTTVGNHIFHFDNRFDSKISFSNGICYSFVVPPTEADFNCTWLDPGVRIATLNRTSVPIIRSLSVYPGKEFLAVYYIYGATYGIESVGSTWLLNSRTDLVHLNGGLNLVQFFSAFLASKSGSFSDGIHFDLVQFPQISGIKSVLLANITVVNCPPGFVLRGNVSQKCDCEHILTSVNATCNPTSGLVNIPANSWAGFRDDTILYAAICPSTRCGRQAIIDLSDPDYLCINNHAGDVCGLCQDNHSAIFGSHRCLVCPNTAILTILGYVLAGIFFVIIIFALNLTVSSGTICGVVFYANFLNLSIDDLLIDIEEYNIYPLALRIFISVINLDLGFPICFYNGMTVPVKFGLQFVFPVYLWLIVFVLIVACRFSIRLSNKLGSSCVPVLAGSHVALILFAIVFTALYILPFSFILTFSSFLLRFKFFSNFLPLIDAYSGPFQYKFRFWFGVRLWFIFLMVFLYSSVHSNYSIPAVYFSHAIAVFFLIIAQIFLKPFKDKLCRMLDLFYLINYCLIAITGTFLSDPSELYARTVVATVLVSSGFIVFIGIVLLQMCRMIKNTAIFNQAMSSIPFKVPLLHKKDEVNDELAKPLHTNMDATSASVTISAQSLKQYNPTSLRDSILDSYN